MSQVTQVLQIDFTKFADRENGARLALEKRGGGGGGSADHSNHATLFLCSLSSKAWSLEEVTCCLSHVAQQ
jgi:hypothetical protein